MPTLEPSRPTLSAPKFGRGLTTLSLSWMHGRIEAVAVQRGEPTGTWEKSGVGDDPAQFGEWVKEAAARTGYRGGTVTLLLAHPRLTHQLIEVPPARGSALRGLVERQVEKSKVFEGAPAWAYQPALPTKNSQSVLVHLFPRDLLDRLVSETQRAGLHLVGVTPSTAVLHAQIGRLPLKQDEVALVAGDAGGMTSVVVGRADGQLLMARSLDGTRTRDKGGVAVDMSRTLLFVSQQFGVNVAGVWWFGPGTSERLAELNGQLPVAVQASPEEHRPVYWAEESARLGPAQSPNLISAEVRRAPQQRAALRVTALVALLLAAGALATAAFCEVLVRTERAAMRDLELRQAQLQSQHRELQRTHQKLERRSQWAQAVLDGRPAPVPVWFLAYLSEAVPTELVVTNLHLRQEGARWQLQLAGGMPSATNAAQAMIAGERIAEMTERLRSGPFQVSLTAGAPDPVEASEPARPKSAIEMIAVWAARPAPGATGPTAPPGAQFNLQGVLQ